jgi:DNA-binding LacI/PurR family transcriptional regulator
VQPSGFPVSQAITLYDVAREAGVSIATVSRVTHNQGGVRPGTRQRVLDVIEALGYFPDGAAQSMARQRKEVIGLLGMDSRSPETDLEEEGMLFGDMVQRGVEWALRDSEWSLLISLVHNYDPAGAFRRIQKIGEGRRHARHRGHRRRQPAGAPGGADSDRADRGVH